MFPEICLDVCPTLQDIMMKLAFYQIAIQGRSGRKARAPLAKPYLYHLPCVNP